MKSKNDCSKSYFKICSFPEPSLKRFSFCIAFFFVLVSASVAQTSTISGTIRDAENRPVEGATVVVQQTKASTIADSAGRFSINAVKGQTLTVSSVNFESTNYTVGDETDIQITLQSRPGSLGEVVVIGYGTVRRRDVTGSISQVKSKDINAYPATNVLQALAGRSTGVQVLQNGGAPGGGISVIVRGRNSVLGSNEPLYVIDGFPTGGNATQINNEDIETIEILKDASATAIYGSRGANGVVLITTKRGRAGKTRVDFETSYSIQQVGKKLELMNAREYALFYNEQAVNDGLTPFFTPAQIDSFSTRSFDWQDLVFKTAPMRTHALNINGGNDKTQFSISGTVFSQEGIVKGSDYNRYSLRTNINHTISSKFSANISSVLSRINTGRRDSEGGPRGGSLFSSAVSAPPTVTPYNPDGSYRRLAILYPFVATDLVNPLNFINESYSNVRSNQILANGSISYKPIPEITIKILGGVENADDRTDSYTSLNFINSNGAASVSANQFTSFLSENTVSYNKTFNGKHNVSGVAGFTYQNFLFTSLGGSGNGYLSNVFQTYNLGAASTPGIPSSGYSKSTLLSYLARVNYGYDNRYLATFSVRRDGSSKYTEGNKWGVFPSAAFGWNISNEKFFNNVKAISNLKLRASWGFTGSQAIDPYATLNQLGSGRTVFNDVLFPTFAPGTRLPGDLKWETTEQKNVGLDIGILKNRISFTADYYIKNTTDLLNTVLLPASLGFTNTIRNVGEVQNKGFEFGIDANVLPGKFRWDVNANISFNRNKVLKLNDNQDILGGSINVVVVNDVTNILRVGAPIGSFWGYQEDGYTAAGRIKYKDLSKDGAFNLADKTIIGDPNPDFTYGFNSAMSYANFEFSFFIQGVQGNDILNISAIPNTIDYGFGLNMTRDVFLNHWTPTNTNAKYPIISRNTTATLSDRFVEDGSYLRLKNIMLAYNLPVKKLRNGWIQNLQVYASGQNLLTVTNYSWSDPEVNTGGRFGYDFYGYPIAKSYTFGIRAGF